MNLKEALPIIIELADQNMLTDKEVEEDPEFLQPIQKKQAEAITLTMRALEVLRKKT